jgi:hypothetical protein
MHGAGFAVPGPYGSWWAFSGCCWAGDGNTLGPRMSALYRMLGRVVTVVWVV